jgi:hypothetical protein
LPQDGYTPDDDRPLRPEKGYGQVRLCINRGIPQRAVKAKNIWWAGEDQCVFEAVKRDKAFPFFGRFEDLEELLRTFLDDEMSMQDGGIWDFGNKGSPNRLLYTGFAALECGQWDLAISSLKACRETVMALEWPTGDIIRAFHLPYVDVGLASAGQRRRWSLS